MARIKSKRKKKLEKKLDSLKDDNFEQCSSCNKRFMVKDLIFGPCPFVSEIYPNSKNAKIDIFLCSNCYQEACWDI